MPIYEFRCIECDQVYEVLVMSSQEDREIKCPHCGGQRAERVLSTASYSVAPSSSGGAKAAATTKSCTTGSCSTLEIPGGYD